MVRDTSPAGDVNVMLLFVTWHPLPSRHGNWCGRFSLTATMVYGDFSQCFIFPAMPNDKFTIVGRSIKPHRTFNRKDRPA